MRYVGGDESYPAVSKIRLEIVADRHVTFGEHACQLEISPLGMVSIGADEERGPVVLNPIREPVELPVDAVEQHDAAHAILPEAAVVKRVGGRQEAAAVADDHDAHVG